jgi:hypothetical protein
MNISKQQAREFILKLEQLTRETGISIKSSYDDGVCLRSLEENELGSEAGYSVSCSDTPYALHVSEWARISWESKETWDWPADREAIVRAITEEDTQL